MADGKLEPDRRQWVLEVLEQFEAPLLRYARRLTGDEHAACDLVQHTFLRLCDRPPDSFRHGVGAWLYAVCRNRAIDVNRKEQRMESWHADVDGRLPADDPGPAETVESRDVAAQLRNIVGTLNVDQQEAVDLWSEGFSYREISQITSRNENTIRVQVHRALKHLRQHPLVRQMLAEHADLVSDAT